METFIKVQPQELTYELLDNIRGFLGNKKNFEITITIKEKEAPNEKNLFGEPEAEYETRLNKSISDIENDRGLIPFTVEEFEKFVASTRSK
jgi:hypothetical protein